MAHHKFNLNNLQNVPLDNYKTYDFSDDYFVSFQPKNHRLFKRYEVPKVPRLRPRGW